MRSTEELLKDTTEEDWVIKNLLPVGGKLMLGGSPKAGKSYNVLKLAHCVLREPFFHGNKVDRHGRVLMVEFDMPESSHRRRIASMHGIVYDFNGMYHITRKDAPRGFSILNQPHYNWLAAQVTDLKPALIIIDVYRSLYIGNENDSSLTAEVMMRLDELLLEGDSSAVLLHHTKKSGFDKETGTSMSPIEAVRGSSVIAGSMDTIMALSDTGHGMQVQGRDVGNLSYYIKREFGGLPNRHIKKAGTNRQFSMEKLLAGFHIQCPKESSDTYFKWMSEYVEDMNKEEYEQIRSIVSSNPSRYEWA